MARAGIRVHADGEMSEHGAARGVGGVVLGSGVCGAREGR